MSRAQHGHEHAKKDSSTFTCQCSVRVLVSEGCIMTLFQRDPRAGGSVLETRAAGAESAFSANADDSMSGRVGTAADSPHRRRNKASE